MLILNIYIWQMVEIELSAGKEIGMHPQED
jgi:hypothetical protein